MFVNIKSLGTIYITTFYSVFLENGAFFIEFFGVSLLVRKWPANSGLMYTSSAGADTGIDLGGALFLSIILKKMSSRNLQEIAPHLQTPVSAPDLQYSIKTPGREDSRLCKNTLFHKTLNTSFLNLNNFKQFKQSTVAI